MRKTGVVVPCYNEAARLNAEAFLAALENNINLSFLFVDDGSTDETVQVLKTIEKQNSKQTVIIRLEKNSGKAEAVRIGMLKAIEGSFEYVGYWDADLSTPLEAINGFCGILDAKNIEIVIGSRICLLGRQIERNVIRHYLGRLFATCASSLLGMRVYDTQCGSKIFKNTDVLKKVFSKPFMVTWIFDVELLARFPIVLGSTPIQVSSKWFEYPLDKWLDVTGSKIKIKDYIKGGLEFCVLFYYLCTPARKRYAKYILGISE